MIEETTFSAADRLARDLRTNELFRSESERHHTRTDRLFGGLMLVQWVFAVVLAATLGPYAWDGTARSVHVHMYAAFGLGWAITALPLLAIYVLPGAPITRHIIACAQMLWSALLIHISGGRIETHFHIFGSLAFLSFYRDYRVLVPATLTIAVDHLVRGMYFPESIYGVSSPDAWRFLEHAGWVVFEDVVLVIACIRGEKEMHMIAEHRAELELLEKKQRAKTVALDAALAELRTSQDALVRSERLAAVGQLAASVGHELRNPLAAVRNAHTYIVRRLDAGPAIEPRVRQFLGIIERELDACSRIIGDLLDFARERPLARAPCSLHGLVEEAKSVLVGEARVSNEIPEALPLPEVDRDQFRQVLVNLLQNAIEAIPSDRLGHVRVAATANVHGIELTVADEGVGMTEQVASRIFEPLYTTKTKGTGLGLAIVSKIVRAHQGRIHVESEVDRGTRFVIELPTRTAAVA